MITLLTKQCVKALLMHFKHLASCPRLDAEASFWEQHDPNMVVRYCSMMAVFLVTFAGPC